jgi:hypothetical protein
VEMQVVVFQRFGLLQEFPQYRATQDTCSR